MSGEGAILGDARADIDYQRLGAMCVSQGSEVFFVSCFSPGSFFPPFRARDAVLIARQTVKLGEARD